LKVKSLHFGGARADQRKAALVVRIDELGRVRRGFGQDAEPAEWIVTCVFRSRLRGYARPAYTMKAVASRDEIAREFLLASI